MTVWTSTPPVTCELCGDVIMDEFVDGKVGDIDGMPWACMCPYCAKHRGVGCGPGKGQRYKQQGEDYVKVEG